MVSHYTIALNTIFASLVLSSRCFGLGYNPVSVFVRDAIHNVVSKKSSYMQLQNVQNNFMKLGAVL